MDSEEEDTRVWDTIQEREMTRRRNLDELKGFMEEVNKTPKSAKTLLKLVVFTESIKVSEAAQIIGVKKQRIEKWLDILLAKKLVDIESTHTPDPTVKPTEKVKEKVRGYYKKSMIKNEGKAETEKVVDAVEETTQEYEQSQQDETMVKDGGTYLVFEEAPSRGFEIITNRISDGAKGLVITRLNPKKVMKKNGLESTRVIWLSSVGSTESVETVSGIQDLSILVGKFIDKNKKSAILLDGVEYLIANNKFGSILKLIQQLRDRISTSESVLVMPLNPHTLGDKELSLLKLECKTVK